MWDVRDNNKIIHILKYIPMRLVTNYNNDGRNCRQFPKGAFRC